MIAMRRSKTTVGQRQANRTRKRRAGLQLCSAFARRRASPLSRIADIKHPPHKCEAQAPIGSAAEFVPSRRRTTANVPASAETRTFRALLQRLTKAGFSRDFVPAALLPDWWDDACTENPALVQDFGISSRAFPRKPPLDAIVDSNAALSPTPYPHARLRRVRDVNRDRLAAAIHVAMQVASAAVRNLRDIRPTQTPPADGFGLAGTGRSSGRRRFISAILFGDLLARGIPVISRRRVTRSRFSRNGMHR